MFNSTLFNESLFDALEQPASVTSGDYQLLGAKLEMDLGTGELELVHSRASARGSVFTVPSMASDRRSCNLRWSARSHRHRFAALCCEVSGM